MFYMKNVPMRHRILRVVLGILVIGAGLYWFWGTAQGYLDATAGILLALTGFVGYCPFCSIANRMSAPK